MRADGTIGIYDRDRSFEDWLECLPDIKPLGLAADEHRYRLEFAFGSCRAASAAATRAVSAAAAASRADVAASSLVADPHWRHPIAAAVPRSSATACALASAACSFASAEMAEPSSLSAAASCASATRFRFSAARTGTLACVASRKAVPAASRASAAFFVACCASAAREAARAATPASVGTEADGRAQQAPHRLAPRSAHTHRGHIEQASGEVEGQPDAAMGRRTPGRTPPCSAMPDQVMRCICGMKASSYRFE